jgi:glycosyltransferase involved in cell wall biosynthesis
MNSLYNHPKIKAMISLTKGEGFGRPLLEFSLTGKPVIASNWSGHIDFLKHSILLPGELKEIHKSAADKFLMQGTKWFTVDYGYVVGALKDVTKNYKNYLKNAREQLKYSKENFSLDKMNELFVSIVDRALEGVPQEVQLKLPKLKKVDVTDTPKLKLPKLKKMTSV